MGERPRIVSTISMPSSVDSAAVETGKSRGNASNKAVAAGAGNANANAATSSASKGGDTGRPRPVSLTGLELDLSFGEDAVGTTAEEAEETPEEDALASKAELPSFSPMTAANGGGAVSR